MNIQVLLAGLSAPRRAAATLGLLAGTQVQTMDGLLPVEFLASGDRIVTRAGSRRLQSVSFARYETARLVRIRAATLGHDRPEQDLVLGCDQPVLIRDWRASALYGVSVAAIPAARLADGEFIVTESATLAGLFTLRFAEDEVIYAEGLQIACPADAMAFAPLPA